jgi:hypothetical protein
LILQKIKAFCCLKVLNFEIDFDPYRADFDPYRRAAGQKLTALSIFEVRRT